MGTPIDQEPSLATPVKSEPVKTSAMSKQSIVMCVLALVVGLAAVGGFYYYLDSLTPKGDPAFERILAPKEAAPTGAQPQAPPA